MLTTIIIMILFALFILFGLSLVVAGAYAVTAFSAANNAKKAFRVGMHRDDSLDKVKGKYE